MKKLLLLLMFVSFAAQGQVNQIRYGDSIYGNTVKFRDIEYQFVENDPLKQDYEDYFWIEVGTVNAINPGPFSPPSWFRVSPSASSTLTVPGGGLASEWWNTVSFRHILQPVKFIREGSDDLHFEIDGFYNRPEFIIVQRSIDRRAGSPTTYDLVRNGDVIKMWRPGVNGAWLWQYNVR